MLDNYKEKYDNLNAVLRFLHQTSAIEMNVNDLISLFHNECRELIKCSASSFFILNQSTFEFAQTGSHSSVRAIEMQKIFDDLLEAGFLTEVLVSGNMSTKQSNINETINLIPLKFNEMVFALLLLVFDSKNELSEENQIVLSALTSIFTSQFFPLIKNEKVKSAEGKGNTDLIDQINNLKQSTEDLHKIIDSIHEGILLVDKATKQIYDANQTAANLICSSKDNLIGKNKDDYFLFFDSNVFKDEIITKEESLLISAEGTAIPIILASKDISLGNYEYQILSFLDISERKMMEDKIQQSRFELEFIVEDRTKELLNSNKELEKEIAEKEKTQKENLKLIAAVQQSDSLIFITDLDGRIEYVNKALCYKSGYTSTELIGKKPNIFKSGDLQKHHYEHLWKTITSGISCSLEFRNRKKNGELFWISTNISPILDDEGNIIKYLAVQEDIGERKKAEEQLTKAKEKVEKAEKAKSSLLANMSHEFRTPLISILGFSELLEYELVDKEQQGMVHAIKSGGKRLLNSLEGILMLSNLESSNLTLITKKINIIPVINSCMELFKEEAEKKKITLDYKPEGQELFITAEEKYLQQTLNYFIDNAVKFTRAGLVKVGTETSTWNKQDYLLVNIQDTGIGIAEEDHEKIFEPFRQASEGYSRDFEGFGLGLTIAKKMIQLMNGRITLKSAPQAGSTFTIWLPVESSNKINSLFSKLLS